MPAHNSHIHTRTHAPRGNAHTWYTFPLPQPITTVGKQGPAPPHHGLSQAELRPSPLATFHPPEGDAAQESGIFLPSRPSHTGKRCLPPPSTPASERTKRLPNPPPLVHRPLTQPGVFPTADELLSSTPAWPLGLYF